MRRIRSLDFELEPSAVCIGKFDGIHRGHRLLIQAAKKTKLPVVMFTFESTRQNGIYSQAEKEDLAEKAGVDIFISVPVTEAFRHMHRWNLWSKCWYRGVMQRKYLLEQIFASAITVPEMPGC